MSILVTRLASLLPSLSEAERRVAAYVLDHVSNVPLQTVRQLASSADVSVASVSRLSARLGCASFREFKIELVRQSASPVQSDWSPLSASDSDEAVVRKVFGAGVVGLQNTLEALSREHLEAVVRKIDVCRRVVFFGAGSSACIAHEAAFRFSQIDIQAEAYSEPHQMTAQAVRTTRQSVAVGISQSGRSKIVLGCLRLARENGAFAVGITGYAMSPIGAATDVTFVSVCPELAVRDFAVSSRLSQSCLIDAILVLVAHRRRMLPTALRFTRVTDELLRVPEEPSRRAPGVNIS